MRSSAFPRFGRPRHRRGFNLSICLVDHLLLNVARGILGDLKTVIPRAVQRERFAIFASFFQMAVLTQGVHFFILGVLGTWLFAAVDACRTAQLMRSGLAPDTEDDVITRRLYGNPLAWGTTLIIIGTLFLLHTLLRVTLPIKELLPVALVALGAYMLFDYIRRGKGSDRIVRFDSRRPPPSVVATTKQAETAAFRTGETTQLGRRDVTPLPFERRS